MCKHPISVAFSPDSYYPTAMRIQNKLFLTLLATSFSLVVLMFAFMRWSIDKGMLEYVNTREAEQLSPLVTKLANAHEEHGNWKNIKHRREFFHQLLDQQSQKDTASPPRLKHQRPSPKYPHKRDMEDRAKPVKIAILDAQKKVIFGRYRVDKPHQLIPINSGSETIGWLAKPKREFVTKGFELAFIEQQTKSFLIISFAVIILTILVSFPLARHFVKPIQLLGTALHRLSSGRYEPDENLTPLQKRRDELGELAKDIGILSRTLSKSETMRKQWLADTSHELRTPVAILLGEIEAMLDEIRPLNRDNLQSLHYEVEHITKLINDLHELSNADVGGLRYQKSHCDLAQIISQQCNSHQQSFTDKQQTLNLQLPTEAIVCDIDPVRITQLLDNLLNNSHKYCPTDSDIYISARCEHQQVIITLEDNGPGVPDSALPQLFDYLYRVETSRNRSTGGSGLGLAIVKRIIEAHHGTITAKRSPLGGLLIQFTLPLGIS